MRDEFSKKQNIEILHQNIMKIVQISCQLIANCEEGILKIISNDVDENSEEITIFESHCDVSTVKDKLSGNQEKEMQFYITPNGQYLIYKNIKWRIYNFVDRSHIRFDCVLEMNEEICEFDGLGYTGISEENMIYYLLGQFEDNWREESISLIVMNAEKYGLIRFVKAEDIFADKLLIYNVELSQPVDYDALKHDHYKEHGNLFHIGHIDNTSYLLFHGKTVLKSYDTCDSYRDFFRGNIYEYTISSEKFGIIFRGNDPFNEGDQLILKDHDPLRIDISKDISNYDFSGFDGLYVLIIFYAGDGLNKPIMNFKIDILNNLYLSEKYSFRENDFFDFPYGFILKDNGYSVHYNGRISNVVKGEYVKAITSDKFIVKNNGLYKVVNLNGQIIVPENFTYIGDEKEGFYGEVYIIEHIEHSNKKGIVLKAKQNDKMYWIEINSNDDVEYSIRHSLAAYDIQKELKIINELEERRRLDIITKNSKNEYLDFSVLFNNKHYLLMYEVDDLSYVYKVHKTGQVEKLPYQYCYPLVYEYFKLNDLHVCSISGKMGIINGDGNIIVPFEFTSLEVVCSDKYDFNNRNYYAVVDRFGKKGLIKLESYDVTYIIAPEYEIIEIMDYDNLYFRVTKMGRSAIYSKEGKMLEQFQIIEGDIG